MSVLSPSQVAAAWRPATDQEVERDLESFASVVKQRFGDRLKAIYLFGSRSRGDHHADSDADVAVVMSPSDESDGDAETILVNLAYDVLLAGRTVIQPFLVSEAGWDDPDVQDNQFLGRAMRRDGRPIP